jgi:hypothetical protein
MRKTRAQELLAAALLVAVLLTTGHAYADSAVFHPLTLAPADAPSSGGGGAGDEQSREAELAKQSLNPVADLTIVPIQNNWDFGIGPAKAMRYTANLQPGYRYYAEGPSGGPDWGLRFTVFFFFK